MGDHLRSQQLSFTLPCSQKKTDQQDKRDQQDHIEDHNSIQRPFPRIGQVKIETGSECSEQPGQSHRNGIDNSAEKTRYLRIPALFHIDCRSIPTQGISNSLKSRESPLNTLKSTFAIIPFTFPWSLCCQNDQSRLIRGCSFT